MPEATTALLVTTYGGEDDDDIIIAGVYLWRKGQWISEDTGKPCGEPFWWTLEDEIVATVRRTDSSVRTK